jgi:N-acetyl-gamma-glutamyl-phosphate/LysW-gamma-L-alpha-aminoadipyl-6-phosphate reductase
LREAQIFEQWYGKKHDQTRLLSEFVYGIAEIHREKIRNAQFIACGGCEATAIILSLYPLTSNHLIELHGAIADVKIGSSAAGSKASGSSHHPERHGLLRSYKPTGHRHEAEIQQELGISVEMSSTAVNIVRGILATIHVQLKEEVTEKDVWRAYRKVYGKEPFIRLIKQRHGLYRYPEPKILWGTNYCDIGFEKSGGSNRLVVLSAIDNLVKGTAGQAVQCMNLMLGFPEETGLAFPGLHPI